ncbi:MAG: hypothetical protein A3C43_05880 [Candidatus Schekmanbacteria bacterium RIFCSPHIGHO2_02_FULL_38_11]|uniref:Pseudouridine synthase n=1 Tax=Candidatus Schekmanbacteria bacterium RIFCSPLOWO2_12_FULL_38_15 TaxID=1817883 RepID=A0A1F7SNP4_9BACT|nr:MAG: hypothetical protein A2043_06560 [Candidatus Schekmanbacteria bacterium GWA2_38_9]OGL50279.1 MAG: hypothetical protein A3H37_00810 [Candidatus Schekmanbacteria bacterium RIFCSPLOWO2_02_FULL_38_14]OGL55410.1 MAG: hypothetical protein A3G31_01190 [Candidatus Schekmanbacteria bacterium RIFCSPLOWO2_12_FULL_38_15]OGL55675.1 MAG: hypothetical protein A3C43_05880 [Candidatus Schekmanbacteria bacterium RIFCSPHIGHO2_02_FULL_38_11]
MAKEKRIIFSKDFRTVRLDKFLREEFPFFSRKSIQNIFNEKNVMINGTPGKKGDILRQGDLIHIKNIPSPDKLELKPNPLLIVKIIYKDKDIIMLDKPSGIPSHPLDSEEKDTAANFLIAKFPEIKDVGKKPLEPGMINRLDIGTSGLLLIARNHKIFEKLKKEQKDGRIKKEYMSLVIGEVKEGGIIKSHIGHHPKNKRKMKIFYSDDKIRKFKARKAITSFEIYKRYSGYTLLKVLIEKGLMHQIRVHLSDIGYPIAGDKLYQTKKIRGLDSTGLEHQFLHASDIEFYHPSSGKLVNFSSQLPEELINVLKTILSQPS